MAISYVGGKTASRAGATSTLSVTLNTGLSGGSGTAAAVGDLILVTVVCGTGGRVPTTNVSGYNSLAAVSSTAVTFDTIMTVSYKIATSADLTSGVTIPSTGNVQDAQSYAIQVFRGVDPTTPINNSIGVGYATATGTGTSRANPPSITPTTAGSYVAICAGGAATTTTALTFTGVSGMLSSVGSDTNDSVVGVGYVAWSSGAVDIAASTTGSAVAGADSWGAYAIILNPFVAPPKTATFSEDFQGAVLNSAIWSAGYSTQLSGANDVSTDLHLGLLRCTPNVANSGITYILSTKITYDLESSSLYFRIPAIRSNQVELFVGITKISGLNGLSSLNDRFGVTTRKGFASADLWEGGSFTALGGPPQADVDIWYRLRKDATRYYWDYAADDGTGVVPASWTNYTSELTGGHTFDTTSAYITIAYDSSASIVNLADAVAFVDSINAAGIPNASSVTENFNAAIDTTTKWFDDPFLGSNTVTGGQLQQIGSGSGAGSALLHLRTDVFLDTMYTRFVQPMTGTSAANSSFIARDATGGAGNDIYIRYSPSTNQIQYGAIAGFVGAVGSGAVTYNSSTHGWFRIKRNGANLEFYTAPPSASNPPASGDWTLLGTVALSAISWWTYGPIEVLYQTEWNSGTATAPTIWDGFNAAATNVTVAGGTVDPLFMLGYLF